MISGAGKGAVKRSPLQEQVLETGKQLLSRELMRMCSLSRAQAILSTGTKAATLKEW